MRRFATKLKNAVSFLSSGWTTAHPTFDDIRTKVLETKIRTFENWSNLTQEDMNELLKINVAYGASNPFLGVAKIEFLWDTIDETQTQRLFSFAQLERIHALPSMEQN